MRLSAKESAFASIFKGRGKERFMPLFFKREDHPWRYASGDRSGEKVSCPEMYDRQEVFVLGNRAYTFVEEMLWYYDRFEDE